jgi:hypothetical protein
MWDVPRPACKCGCGTLTRWLSTQGRWAVYAKGHRWDSPYLDKDWLCEEYVIKGRTFEDIAQECGVNRSSVRRAALRMGIQPRDRSESRIGRKVGPKNPAWKGGVADWDYAAGWKVIARKIRDRDEWTCQRCGEQRKHWGHALHVHHIDGDKLNNDPGNLTSLCASCHMQAHREEVMLNGR